MALLTDSDLAGCGSLMACDQARDGGVVASDGLANNRWAATSCWLGALFTGFVLPVALLLATWRDRGSLTRRHAMAASIVWIIALALYLPIFFIGIWIPAFNGHPPQAWAVIGAVAIAVTSWVATAVGLIAVWRTPRHPSAAVATDT